MSVAPTQEAERRGLSIGQLTLDRRLFFTETRTEPFGCRAHGSPADMLKRFAQFALLKRGWEWWQSRRRTR